jgi:hypothetical protein
MARHDDPLNLIQFTLAEGPTRATAVLLFPHSILR